MQLVMPMNYEYLEQEDMMYLDGGFSWNKLSKVQKALVIGLIAVVSVGVITAIVTGTVAVAVSSFSTVMRYGAYWTLEAKLGAKAAVTVITTAMGASGGIVAAIINKYAR